MGERVVGGAGRKKKKTKDSVRVALPSHWLPGAAVQTRLRGRQRRLPVRQVLVSDCGPGQTGTLLNRSEPGREGAFEGGDKEEKSEAGAEEGEEGERESLPGREKKDKGAACKEARSQKCSRIVHAAT